MLILNILFRIDQITENIEELNKGLFDLAGIETKSGKKETSSKTDLDDLSPTAVGANVCMQKYIEKPMPLITLLLVSKGVASGKGRGKSPRNEKKCCRKRC